MKLKAHYIRIVKTIKENKGVVDLFEIQDDLDAIHTAFYHEKPEEAALFTSFQKGKQFVEHIPISKKKARTSQACHPHFPCTIL